MAIIYNTGKGGFFSGRSAKILTPSFRIFVTTAKKSLFSGFSTSIIHETDGMPWGHIIYLSALTKKDRLAWHDQIVKYLNEQGEQTSDPPNKILQNLKRYLEDKDATSEILIIEDAIMSRNEALQGMLKVIEDSSKGQGR
ncbi:MAG: hypothetical protein IID15_07720 [Candidatus Marinimicrobia bacterium]|nr:hypothetical protein [Candidatus Neomarinimicrobiota bacterium]